MGGGINMKNDVENVPMTFVWYAVAALVVIGIILVVVVAVVANHLNSSF
jgi:hypothetical protein